MKCACQKPPAASPAPPEVPPCHIKKTMHFYPGDFDAFWRRRWHEKSFNQFNCLDTEIAVCLCYSTYEVFFCEGRHFTFPLKWVGEKGWSL